MRSALLAFFIVLTTALATPVFAGGCYTMQEAEAEQGIRIHSELMVIGLNCQAMRFSDGTNLFVEYQKFTSAHAPLFAQYEETLMSYYRRNGSPNPEAAINTLRTNFANKISLDSVNMKPDIFCNRYAGRIIKVQGMDNATIRRWAATIYPSHPVSRPICEP